MGENEIKINDYINIIDCWNNPDDKFEGEYSVNYRLNNNIIAKHRFKKDVFFILDNLPPTKERFLDLGCGSGNYINILLKKFNYCEGVDFSEHLSKVAIERFEDIHNVEIKRENVVKITLKNVYDLINIGELLMYLNDDDVLVLLQKIHKNLSDSGLLTIRESVSTQKTVNLNYGKHETIRRTQNHYNGLFKKAEFRLVKIKQNYDYNYAWMTEIYFKPFPFLLSNKKFLMFFLNNKITRLILLFFPLKILTLFSRNFFVHYYFLLEKNN